MPDNQVEEIAEEQEVVLSNQERLVLNLATCPNVHDAGIASGYSEAYSTGPIYKLLKSETFQAKLRNHYRGSAASFLPFIQAIELKALNHVNGDITQLPKFSRTLKELKQAAGVLSQDSAPGVVLVKVQSIQNVMLNVQQGKESPLSPLSPRASEQDVIEVDVHEVQD